MANGPQTQQGGAERQRLTQAARLAASGMGSVGTGCGCCGCGPGCGCVGTVLLGLVMFLAITYYACNEAFWGVGGWVESLAAKIGLSPGICSLFK